MKIIYIIPFKILKSTNNHDTIKQKLIDLLYSMLLVNTYYSDDITIYTDFDGMSIYSILPFNIEIVNSTTIDTIYDIVKKKQKSQYLILNEKVILKPIDDINNNYVLMKFGKPELNPNLIETNIDSNLIYNELNYVLDSTFIRFLNRINEKLL